MRRSLTQMCTPILPLAGRGCNAGAYGSRGCAASDHKRHPETTVANVTITAHAGARRPTRGRDRLGNGDPFLQFLEPVLHHMDFSPGVLAGAALVR